MSNETTSPARGEDEAGSRPAEEAAAQAPGAAVEPPTGESADVEPAGAGQPGAIESPELAAAVEALGAREDELLRLKAEMENLRRRAAREVENAHKYGTERLVGELLPVKDSMELGLKAASVDGVDVASVREGLELTLKMLVAALDKVGVAEVDPLGQPFDPEFHQAMTIQPSEHAEPDSVLTVFQKGYLLEGRLVRPAMVVVAKAPDPG